jgi:fatty acid desaturase
MTSMTGYLSRARWVWFTVSVTLGALLGVSAVGAWVSWWGWLPIRLHQLVALLMVATFMYALRVSPAAEAFRLGMEAGMREQARQCAATCGHSCDHDSVIRVPQPIR